MNLCGYYRESINEGLGIRSVIFISGCRHRCKGCFNPESWNFELGEPFDERKQLEIINDIKHNPLVDGITFCGGDPFFSASELIPFVQQFRRECSTKNVWAYSGFTYEEIMADEKMHELLTLCDVLVDGRFEEKQKDLTLAFRGSRNQRIIDVTKSLAKEHIELVVC
ncbi:anaerobic ribonucleoside-triphosphate reductase activating protein [Paenibacillus sp. N1-5-1-14]|uniref:anaerobic ribonucleoside-triphosphate reductase activating protein n=1 Tax=Paenibacillus radicibacter TaxID=2972488 RepID=UPI0021599086|nr:anaerobic ribonucleoside-triphosphate reductase activating protein [Paenibacillus radicibacter]MCR8641066.1 anaerobic ribonucleoside-triphosphate reductase activating protein [Paenibacillus radicibacter]